VSTLVLPAHHDAPFYDFTVALEGRSYAFEIRWNARAGEAGQWFITTRDADGVILVAGRAIVLAANLLGAGVSEALPPGTLLAVDTSSADTDPLFDDLGDRVLLAYVESTG
jgi:hypothetical protein